MWVGDITYIKTSIGWAYLVVVIDLFNREIIGYGVSKKINAELVKPTLANAIARSPENDLTFYSDRGCQYASKTYQQMLKENGICGSMSRPGCYMIMHVQRVCLQLLKKKESIGESMLEGRY